jgi:ethanolamine permease
MDGHQQLKKTLGPVMLWGLGVGYVISGMYFGWNLGLPKGGPYGMLVASLLVTLLYVTFVLSYTELTCAMPKAGGAFVYATRAFGPAFGYFGGVAQIVEFVFAPPAIAMAIGSYFSTMVPQSNQLVVAVIAYFIFTGLNIYGVKHSAIFELGITILAVGELLLFAGLTLPSFSLTAFTSNPLPNGWLGVLPAIPFAIWFYLAIEGVANVAEETRDHQRDPIIGFLTAMATLVVCATLTFYAATGVKGWEAIVYTSPDHKSTSDSPLPLALSHVIGVSHPLYHMLVAIGIFGLIASFHGIILAAGRATFEFGRMGYAPAFLGTTLRKRQTPAWALLINMLVGIVAVFSGRTPDIITISVFGALTLYIVSLAALFKLRKTEPNLERPYKTPFYPVVPGVSLVLSVFCLGAMTWYNKKLAVIYAVLVALGYVWYGVTVQFRRSAPK